MDIHVFQHVSFENPGYIQQWANKNNHTLKIINLFDNDDFPDDSAISALILLGGPMSVTEEEKYSWLRPEKALIKKIVLNNIPVLGICLGAQLIANSLGAKILINKHKEIGWLPIKRTNQGQKNRFFMNVPDNLTVFHWHGETFELPEGAEHLAFSSATKNQAFALGSSLGLQFHFEVMRDSLEALTTHCADELIMSTFVQTKDDILSVPDEHIHEMNGYMEQILDNWIEP